MNNTIKKICRLLLILGLSLESSAQDPDSLVHLRKNPFFQSLFAKKDVETVIDIRKPIKLVELKNEVINKKDLILVKNRKGVFLQATGTSRVYQLMDDTDTTWRFSRLDHIENINYNINAYSFSHNNTLYNYGGYGFWKSNGLLRRFNEKNKEWDIVPLNKEIHINNEFQNNWKDPHNPILYVLFEHELNEGLKLEKNKTITARPISSTLDLSTNTIDTKGKLNDLIFPAFHESTVWHTDQGIILVRIPNSYYLKPKENKLFAIEDPSLIQSLVRFKYDHISYYSKGKFYFWNPNNLTYDSLELKDLKLKPIGHIWSTPFPIYYSIGASILLLTCVVFLIVTIKKKKASSLVTNNDKGNIVPAPLITETEISLIKLLIEKSEQNEYASSNEINYIIGCKDKNVGLQKKMRSDIINSINTKYKAFIKVDCNLIESKRTDYDKRYFHYHISEDQLDKAKSFTELNP